MTPFSKLSKPTYKRFMLGSFLLPVAFQVAGHNIVEDFGQALFLWSRLG
jgi:hypothetical protein